MVTSLLWLCLQVAFLHMIYIAVTPCDRPVGCLHPTDPSCLRPGRHKIGKKDMRFMWWNLSVNVYFITWNVHVRMTAWYTSSWRHASQWLCASYWHSEDAVHSGDALCAGVNASFQQSQTRISQSWCKSLQFCYTFVSEDLLCTCNNHGICRSHWQSAFLLSYLSSVTKLC